MSEYVDTIDKVLEYLKIEKDRRLTAIKSNEFCDNKTGERHIRILKKGIKAMEQQIKIENNRSNNVFICRDCERWNNYTWSCKYKGMALPHDSCNKFSIKLIKKI